MKSTGNKPRILKYGKLGWTRLNIYLCCNLTKLCTQCLFFSIVVVVVVVVFCHCLLAETDYGFYTHTELAQYETLQINNFQDLVSWFISLVICPGALKYSIDFSLFGFNIFLWNTLTSYLPYRTSGWPNDITYHPTQIKIPFVKLWKENQELYCSCSILIKETDILITFIFLFNLGAYGRGQSYSFEVHCSVGWQNLIVCPVVWVWEQLCHL